MISVIVRNPNGTTCAVAPQLVDMLVPIDDLVLDPENARLHGDRNIEAIKASLAEFGQDQPVVVRAEDMVIYKGNGRVLAARALGWTHIAALAFEGPKADFVARAIADNRTAELAEWDESILAGLLDDLPDAYDNVNLGFTDKAVDRLLASLDEANASGDEGSVSALPENPVTVPGDMWICGPHRIVCGDCTDPDVTAQALASGPANMLLTDPPYGVAYSPIDQQFNGTHRHDAITNDDDAVTDMAALFEGFLKAARMADRNTAYVFMSNKHYGTMDRAFFGAGWYKSASLVWMKNAPVLGRQDYMQQHEHILYGWKDRHEFFGKKRASVLQYDRSRASDLHPTMKPVALLVSLITDGSKRGATVYDPFLGSGSTLIAAEQTSRTCVGIELVPGYCDVSVRRWQDHSGEKAIRESDGTPFNDLKAATDGSAEADT